MVSLEETQRYLNSMARAFRVLASFPLSSNQLCTIQGYNSIMEQTRDKLTKASENSCEQFLLSLDSILKHVEGSKTFGRYVQAKEICLWMDARLCYSRADWPQKLSLARWFPIQFDTPVFSGALNTNAETTGIELHPRFPVRQAMDLRQEGETERYELRRLANRDIFSGINGELQNLCCVEYVPNRKIHHAVFPARYGKNKADAPIRIAFCPMSDDQELLNLQNKKLLRQGIPLNSVSVKSLNNPGRLKARLKRDWKLACAHQADIIFFPELLGTKSMEYQEFGYHKLIQSLSIDAAKKGFQIPLLTVLPSYWKDGVNRAAAVFKDGRILGYQEKHIPFVDEKAGVIEALEPCSCEEYLILHIPGIHRIAIMICAEFLAAQSHRLQEVICGQLGVSMIIVPSYSKGEQDFVNSLPALSCYGTTVLWGDCCGAARSPRIIGGCGIAGTHKTLLFGDCCSCGDFCGEKKACAFLVTLPQLYRQKPSGVKAESIIEHIFI